MYNKDEVKSYGFRLSRRISKEIQRDEHIHPLVKSNFVSNTALNEDAGGLEGYIEININDKPLDNKLIAGKIGGNVLNESLNAINNIINRILLQEQAKDVFNVTVGNPTNEVFNFHNKLKNRFTQFKLESCEAVLSELSVVDAEPDNKVLGGFDMLHRSYYQEPKKEGNATTNDLISELTPKKNDFIKNTFENAMNKGNIKHEFEDLNSSDNDEALSESYKEYMTLRNTPLKDLV